MDNVSIQNACIELTNRLSSHSISDSIAYQLTTELINAATNCNRTSIWMYNITRTKSICKDLFVRDENIHKNGSILLFRENKTYFDAIETTRCVVASDARNHQATYSLSKNYLIPNNIVSKLTLPIIFSGEIIGIICNEQCNVMKDWTVEDITMIQEITHILEPIFESLN
jgi:GAF domain-containing protein